MNMSKKNLKFVPIGVFSVVILILNSGCKTSENTSTTFLPSSSPITEIAKAYHHTETFTASNNISSKNNHAYQIFLQNYKIPDSYDEAYLWRNGKVSEKMQRLKNNKNVDELRTSNVFEYISRVVREINATAKDDFEKAKMAHDITAIILKYDAMNFLKGNILPQDFISVLKSGTAVCEGYSNTYKKFCDELKLPCQVVYGYARGVGAALLDEKDVTNSNHAWNIVQIKDAWYLVDCTWDSGFMQGRSSKQEYITDWLFTKAEHFIYTHLPENENHQLMEKLFSASQFLELPDLRPNFFDAVTYLKTDLPKVVSSDGMLNLEFGLRDSFDMNFFVQNITSGLQISNCTFVKTDGADATAMFSFPDIAKYNVQIFCKAAGTRIGRFCGEFIVDAQSASDVRYPTTFANYGIDTQIISPIEMPLKHGVVQKFSVVSKKKFVVVLIGKAQTVLVSDGKGNFSGEIMIPPHTKEISVAVADNERSLLSIIATYSVF